MGVVQVIMGTQFAVGEYTNVPSFSTGNHESSVTRDLPVGKLTHSKSTEICEL